MKASSFELRPTAPGERSAVVRGSRLLHAFVREETRVGYVDVERTNATEDDGGHGHYLLDCALLGGPMLWHEGR